VRATGSYGGGVADPDAVPVDGNDHIGTGGRHEQTWDTPKEKDALVARHGVDGTARPCQTVRRSLPFVLPNDALPTQNGKLFLNGYYVRELFDAMRPLDRFVFSSG
jgi:hypothetical protein